MCFSPVSESSWRQKKKMLMQVCYIQLDYSFELSPHLQISTHKPDLNC